jgi:DNA (cytosine-5)-methyltransferase 1
VKQFYFIDLFAGIGGMRLAFEAVGGRCVFSSEWDKFAQQTYKANHLELPHGDITQISSELIPKHHILVAGFPCQPFSSIGTRTGFAHRTQGTLFYEIARVLRDKQPQAFLLENVEGLVTHDQGRTLAVIMDTLAELGYQVSYQILDAADFGVPQKRRRIYFVGTKANKTFGFPVANYRVPIGPYVEKHANGYAISDHLQKKYLFKKDDGRPEIVDQNSQIQVKTLVSSYHKIQRLTGTFVRTSTGLRLLSLAECKAIMGFPQGFVFPVSRTQMYRQLGNSVAIPVVQAIAQQMRDALL